MKYIIEVYSKDGIVYYYHPSAYGDMISNNFVRAYDEGFDTVEEVKDIHREMYHWFDTMGGETRHTRKIVEEIDKRV